MNLAELQVRQTLQRVIYCIFKHPLSTTADIFSGLPLVEIIQITDWGLSHCLLVG